ncbi:DUF4263 domain-containing protein [Burkholderia reimsis]|uniref:DUF4263 domain-containing protein n=1 Tax=Burkholderia reimsis TaxID=2234132 RepID=A0A365QX81_9BURK|nr:Shedu immune nuclease family protein [Burkholderia reimsis]RBB40127.1 DUF4263 domain-containing protein [Burkholderia reimsis]
MPINRFRTGNVATEEDGAELILKKLNTARWELKYKPSKKAIDIAKQWIDGFVAPKGALLLADGDGEKKIVSTYPLNTNAASPSFLQPKYDRLRAITFSGFRTIPGWFAFDDDDGDNDDVTWPQNLDDIKEFFRDLPSGFVRDPYFGLGLNYDLRFITDAVEELSGVKTLMIFKGKGESPTYKGSTYSISAKLFDETRKAVNRAHEKALQVASSEKVAYVSNTLLNSVDAKKYPIKSPRYRKDSIVQALGATSPKDVPLSAADRQAVVATVTSACKQLNQSNAAQLLALSHEIEIVSLEALVERMQEMLSKQLNEAAWQEFFRDNQFVLRLAFGFPVVKVGEQFSVGGRKFDGSGDKISDFAMKAAATGNLGLVEIKTPKTALLEKAAYRSQVYAPSRELSGAVNQVLDQAHNLQKNLPLLKESSQDLSLEAYAINGVVIAGRNLTDRAQQKSFELFRNSLRFVLVITFDELLQKLQHLVEVLRPAA